MAVNANTKAYDDAVKRAAMVRLYEQRVNDKVELIIDGHAVRVDKLIRDAKRSPAGFKVLQEAIDQDILKTYKEAGRVSRRSLSEFAKDQLSFTHNTIDETVGKLWRTRRPPATISEDIVLKRPLYKNKLLDQGWDGISIGEKKRIEAIIRKGLADGDTVNKIADNVRKGSAIKISKYQSRALVTTAVTNVKAQVDHEVYKANEKAIDGWQYVSVLDSRTTDICSHRDGAIYPVDDTVHLPPAHFNCRSTTTPVFKSWDDMLKLESVAQVRRRNLQGLTKRQKAFYDGQTPLRISYHEWLQNQDTVTQLKHLGDYKKLELFRTGKLKANKFINPDGSSVGIRQLRRLTDSTHVVQSDTQRFALAKEKLDAMRLWAQTPDDFIKDQKLTNTLRDYFLLQTKELDGTLSLTNYRGTLIGTKKRTKRLVLTNPPRDEQVRYNPVTQRHEDVRLYQPSPSVLSNNLKLVDESELLLQKDKDFINAFIKSLDKQMSVNERAVIADNLRIIFGRYRKNKEPWKNYKAVTQGQIKFDVMNVSDAIETQIRKDSDALKKLLEANYIDPILGPTQLDDLGNNLVSNILKRNRWEDTTAPKIARELRNVFDYKIPIVIRERLSEKEFQQFYLKFAHRLSLADMPDRDNFAVNLGRDLYNLANLNGDRKKWYNLGMKLLDSRNVKKFFEIETMGVQKRRMKSRIGRRYFGPYYDTVSYNIRIVDPRIQEYAKLNRMIDVGMRVPRIKDNKQLLVRPGYKTYWIDRGVLGYEDTRIPIMSTHSFGDFPDEFIDKKLTDALNWTGQAQYKIDEDYYDFINKLLYFKDDKGKAAYYDDLNEYKKYIAARGDTYERFKAMEWLRKNGESFSNNPFIDHRARIYERGLIGPQAGETYRPFLNSAKLKNFSELDFKNFQDQIGNFLGGLDDYFEGRYNSLSFTGRQKIAEKWRPELVKIGNQMLRRKPRDMRAILENDIVARIDGDEVGKFYRLAIETAKIDNYLGGNYSKQSLATLRNYKTALALEQDASSSGAQIIALTTKNKKLAELSNVIPTDYKKRLYDEIAAATFNDPRFRQLNKKLGLTEKDLRKAAKAQNMVTFYGAGERTGALNVEGKLAKILDKDIDVLVVKASERDAVLDQISARIARVERFDPEAAEELRALRANVKDIFDNGLDPGDEILQELWFLDSKTRDFVEKLSASYDKVVTPQDFKYIAKIMSEYLAEEAPILKDFSKFFGRVAEDFLSTSKPSKADFDWQTIMETKIFGSKKKGFVLPDRMNEYLGLKSGEPVTEKFLKRFGFWDPNGNLYKLIYGVKPPKARRTGATIFKVDVKYLAPNLKEATIGGEKTLFEIKFQKANKLPKSWVNVPWVNFDGKTLEQNFTQRFQQRLVYKDIDDNWTTNILNVDQKTEATWWEQAINKDGKINDIADISKARTAYMVNGNHANDATLVKNFHLWGRDNKIETSTVHDAFFTHISDMLAGRKALRKLYSDTLDRNVIKDTLDEMLARGLSREKYKKYLEEAKELGLIPVPGKSKVGGKILKEEDILKKSDILEEFLEDFEEDYGWYGVG